mgnify:CR=1 FL=1|tara:strand:- start:964 stop:1659 length:696 start_codon:yes stop_codon:yes gene_type:complete
MSKKGIFAVAISSPKGGVSKTTLCHSGCWAAVNNFNTASYLIHTDNTEPVSIDASRGYRQYDCQFAADPIRDKSGEQLEKVKYYWNNLIEMAPKDERSIMFVDNGGNKEELALFLAKLADLIIIPTVVDGISFKRGIQHYNQIKAGNSEVNVRFVVAGHNGKFAKRDQDIWDSVSDELKPLFMFLGKSSDLGVFIIDDEIKKKGWSQPNTPAANYSRAFFKYVLENLPEQD